MSTPAFRTILRGAARQEKVVPLLRAALYDPKFKGFNVKVPGFGQTTHAPDGWFHPSTHPLWPERMLYHYLAFGERMVPEVLDPTSTLAVTAGTFFHSLVQFVLVGQGVLVRQPEGCGCGARHPERCEVYLVDEEVGSRGHCDGLLHDGDGFEFKTAHPAKVGKIPNGTPDDPAVLAWLQDRQPDYYAQAQEYLRMGDRARMVMVMLSLVYPFEMREIWIPYDPVSALAVRDKYLRVRSAVQEGVAPLPCCAPRSSMARACPARLVCEIGLA